LRPATSLKAISNAPRRILGDTMKLYDIQAPHNGSMVHVRYCQTKRAALSNARRIAGQWAKYAEVWDQTGGTLIASFGVKP
jgi:hypothetical protein